MTLAKPQTEPQPQPRRKSWTYHAYCAIPEDGQRYQVIWGELYVAPAPNLMHQRVVLRLGRILDEFVQSRELGQVFIAPTDVVLSEHNVVQPDVLFVAKERAVILTEANVAGSPDLVIEVLSPGTAAIDRSAKADAYAAFGVPHYWTIDPRTRSLEVYELRHDAFALTQRLSRDEVFEPNLFAGLAVSLGGLWA